MQFKKGGTSERNQAFTDEGSFKVSYCNEINYKELQVLQFKYNILQNTENINDTKLQNKYIPEISTKRKVHYI